MASITTQVAIVGAGPAGLLLGHLLTRLGIENVVLEARSRTYVEERIRAGVLEQGTVDLLREADVAERMDRLGLPHEGIELLFDGERHRIDLARLTGGRRIVVYGQHEVVKDLIAARLAAHAALEFDVEDLKLHDIEGERPRLTYRKSDAAHEVRCEFIAGCDGFHGVCRPAVPDFESHVFERIYPFAWLGILVEAPPASDELIYASHERGFALFSMRSPTITRLYLQCEPDEDLNLWSDDRIWSELATRLATRDGWRPHEGRIIQKGVTPMRSFVCEKMSAGRLYLAGDAAHIVPPTGAKGMNLAVSDVRHLARAFERFYRHDDASRLASYATDCLARVWRAEHFSWWMTSMLHRFPEASAFQRRLQTSELRYISRSLAGATTVAENYVGLPWDDELPGGLSSNSVI